MSVRPTGEKAIASHATPTDGVEVSRLIADHLPGAQLVAGHQGTGRVVTWCLPPTPPDDSQPGGPAAGDVRDLLGAAVVVSRAAATGAEAGDLVRDLVRRGAQAVLVPVAQGAAETLAEAARAADELAVPLVAVGTAATFRSVSRAVATAVLRDHAQDLEYGIEVHRHLGDVFARGAGLPALAQAMADLSGTPAVVYGNHDEVLVLATPRSGHRDEPTPGELECVIEAIREHERAADPAGAPGSGLHPTTNTVDLDDGPVEVVHAGIRVADEPFGVLALVETGGPRSSRDLARQRVLVEQGVSLTGSELLRMRSVRQAEERARNDFAHALLHARFTDELELSARAEHYGLPVEGRFAVFVVTTSEVDPDGESARRVVAEVERVVRAATPPELYTLTAPVGAMAVAVRQLRRRHGPDRDARQVTGELHAFGERLQRSLEARGASEVRVAYGRPFNGAAGIAKSYREARTAEGLGRKIHTPTVCSYTDLRVFAAIEECAATVSGQDFATEVLAPLRQLDGQTGNLEELVLAYIEEGGNLNATARRLHLHRNTMLYKLDRASRAVHMDVRTPEAQFMIWLAHHIAVLNAVGAALDRELAPPS